MIGAESNTLALFRFLGSPDTIAVVYSTFLVDCDGIRHFWISWHEGIVRLGTGLVYSANVILEKQVGSDDIHQLRAGSTEFDYAPIESMVNCVQL